jgi:DNA-binding CsgD family transcriptional regulator
VIENDAFAFARLASLTQRERDCLRLVMERRSSKQIARQLGISRTSVDTYVRRAREKLGLRDRYAAARLMAAWQQGEIPPPQPEAPADEAGDHGSFALRLPPLRTLSVTQRVGLILAGAIAAALLFGVLLTAMAAL